LWRPCFPGPARDQPKRSGEEGRVAALESAWDQAEQTKDANALAGLLADSLVYIDYDGSMSTKQQFLDTVKSAAMTGEQINNEEVTMRLFSNNNVAVSTGIYRDKNIKKGKPFQHQKRFTNVWIKDGGTWKCVSSQSTLIIH